LFAHYIAVVANGGTRLCLARGKEMHLVRRLVDEGQEGGEGGTAALHQLRGEVVAVV